MRYIFCFLCCFSFLHVLGSEASLNLQLDNYDQRTRLTIQLNHGLEYKVTHKKNKIMILLPKELALGSPISQKKLPSFIQRMTVAPHDNQLRILLDVVSGVTMRSFRAKNKLIVDVLHITPTRKEQQKEPPDSQKSHHAKPKPASNEPGSLTEPQQEKVESVKVTVHRQMGETPAYLQFHWEKTCSHGAFAARATVLACLWTPGGNYCSFYQASKENRSFRYAAAQKLPGFNSERQDQAGASSFCIASRFTLDCDSGIL